jgi:hypothetical protein
MSLPADLAAAYDSASYLREASRTICHLVSEATETEPPCEALQVAAKLANELRQMLKECQLRISPLSGEITRANGERPEPVHRFASVFPNAHSQMLDIAGLICEVVWDCSFRERGFWSLLELISLPLTPEVMRAALPCIQGQLHRLLGKLKWEELRSLLWTEAENTARAREGSAQPESGRVNPPDNQLTAATKTVITPAANAKPQQAAPEGGWTPALSPSQLAKVFGVSTDSITRWLAEGKIRNKPFSPKAYMVAVEDLPEIHKGKYRAK